MHKSPDAHADDEPYLDVLRLTKGNPCVFLAAILAVGQHISRIVVAFAHAGPLGCIYIV